MNHLQVTANGFLKVKENHDLKGGTAIDVGCRDTCMKDFLESHNYEWTGMDMMGGGDIIQRKMEDMYGIKDDYFDLVFCCHAFEHTERPVEALLEFRRVVKEGGYIFISTPLHCVHQILEADHDHINVLTPMQMDRLLRYTDLEKIDIFVQENKNEEEKSHSMITLARVKHE